MRTRIKFCGFTRAEDVQAAVGLGADALGFVFYSKSPRFVTDERARELIKLVPPFITAVGLFVNATEEQVADTMANAPISLLQFHGDETPEQCHLIAERVRRPYVRALRVSLGMGADDLLECESQYRGSSPWFNGLLLDSHVDGYGGGGKVFDWSIIPKELAPRVVLSGGLTVHNVSGALAQVRPYAVDVSSGVEESKGIKDPAKMRAFVDAVKLADINPFGNKNELQK